MWKILFSFASFQILSFPEFMQLDILLHETIDFCCSLVNRHYARLYFQYFQSAVTYLHIYNCGEKQRPGLGEMIIPFIFSKHVTKA